MAGSSQISRFAVGLNRVQDVRFEPVASDGKSIVTREEMDRFVAEVNDRLRKLQVAYNELAFAARLHKPEVATTSGDVSTATGANGEDGSPGPAGPPGPRGPQGPAGEDGSGVAAGNIDGGRPDEDFTGLDPVDGDTP